MVVLISLLQNFHPASRKQILEHVTTAFEHILVHGVVPGEWRDSGQDWVNSQSILSQVRKSVCDRQVYPEDSNLQDDIFLFQNFVSDIVVQLVDFESE